MLTRLTGRPGSPTPALLYAGAMLGPLGGPMVAVLLPDLARSFDTSLGVAAWSIPAYMLVFAALQLVSGTIGERLGRRRVLVAAYLLYAGASLAAAAAPTLATFLGARALQGAANAFITPLLLAALPDVVPRDRLGRSAGTFAAAQAAGVALGPLYGGVFGGTSWRLVFVVLAAVAVALALVPPPGGRRSSMTSRAALRSVANGAIARLSVAAFAAFAGVGGIGFLVAARAVDAFGVRSAGLGAILAAFGIAGMVAGRRAGAAVDRFGPVPVVLAGTGVTTVAVSSLAAAGAPATLAILWGLAGVGSALIWSALNVLVLDAVPENRAGAASVIGAAKFAGFAFAPLILTPVYAIGATPAFLCAAAIGLLVSAAVLRHRSWTLAASPAGTPEASRI